MPRLTDAMRASRWLFKSSPLGVSDRTVLVCGASLAATVEKSLIVADDIFVEHGDVATSCLQIQVAEQSSTDMDREMVHQVGGEEPAEIMWGEVGGVEGGMVFCEFSATAFEHVDDSGIGDDLVVRADPPLKQERHGRTAAALVRVVARQEWDCAAVARVTPDDGGDDAE